MLWALAAVCLAAALLLYFGIERYRYRFVHTPDDLLALLPSGENTVFFANLGLLRQGGFLDWLSESQQKQEGEYLSFVRETGLDYTKDLQAMAGAAEGDRLVCALQGRFDWSRLRDYVTRHGGRCERALCVMRTGTPGRWVSFRPIQPDVMALSVGGERDGARLVRTDRKEAANPSSAPLWVRPSRALLANPAQLPLPARIFAISVQSAESVLVSARASGGGGEAFEIEMDAAFQNEPTAETARHQLDLDTNMLKLELTREGRKPSPSDLTGVLTSGSFRAAHQHVVGTWPVARDLLRSLQ